MGIGNKNFYKNVRGRNPDIKDRTTQKWIVKNNRCMVTAVSAPPVHFEFMSFHGGPWRQGDTFILTLLFVDIHSRKVWAHTDNEFSWGDEFPSGPIDFFCEDNNIRLDTRMAKEDHIHKDNTAK